jgi:2-polyprenyl-3-methyl-5-hydroxy-6-metoxy-1,4-benzoquinol methylase
MQPPHVKDLVCPETDHALVVAPGAVEVAGGLVEGALRCPLDGRQWPIRGGIPRFAEDGEYTKSFGEQWNQFRRTQLDRFNGTTLSRDRFYQGTGWRADELRGARVLEVGCGAGRFTQVLLDAGAQVFAVDLSTAVDACYANNAPPANLCLAQADVYALPFPGQSFDFVFCYGVLQHTPDPRGAFRRLVAQLRPGGALAIDVYRKGWELQPYKSKYLYRWLTIRLPRRFLFRLIAAYVPRWLPVDTLVKRTPVLGRVAGLAIPCWNYSASPLTRAQQVEWAILDTFDALASRYDSPQTLAAVREWFAAAGLEAVSVRPGGNGILGNGRAPC